MKKNIVSGERWKLFIISFVLIAITFSIYLQIGNHYFINFDDDMYVTENIHVQAGLTGESIIWAFTTTHFSQWHPITWLSHILDYQLYGLNPGGHHLTSLFLHVANSILLFLVLKLMTGCFWQSAFVAAIFSLHPLHVESVAWISERKDVLSTLFWILTIMAYVQYVKYPKFYKYLLVLLLFVLGLMSKPILVTLPFILLLLDYWPLRRIEWIDLAKANESKKLWRISMEKIPFFALSLASCVITYSLKGQEGAINTLQRFLWFRITNSIVSIVKYMWLAVWPANLAVFYPYPMDTLPVWQVAGAGILLISLSILSICAAKNHHYVPVGWFWFIGTLMPVIGLVRVGSHVMADRYMYIPIIGLSIIIAWGIPEIVAKYNYRKTLLSVSAGLLILFLSVCTWFQARHWKNDVTLFNHTLAVTDGNFKIHNNLGKALGDQGNLEQAITHFSKALEIKPDYFLAAANLEIALKKGTGSAETHNNLGNNLAQQGRIDEAISHYLRALRIKPNYPSVLNNLGNAFLIQGKIDKAISYYSDALRIMPDHSKAKHNLQYALQTAKKKTRSSGNPKK